MVSGKTGHHQDDPMPNLESPPDFSLLTQLLSWHKLGDKTINPSLFGFVWQQTTNSPVICEVSL
jgi:hypothetical protein